MQAVGCYKAASASLRLAEGDARAALTLAEQAFDSRASLGTSAQDVKHGSMQAVDAAFTLGDARRPRSCSPSWRRAGRSSCPDTRCHSHRSAPGSRETTRRGSRLHGGGGELRALELPFHLAVVQLEFGEGLTAAEAGRCPTATRGSRETFERLRAVPWLERVDAVAPGTRPK